MKSEQGSLDKVDVEILRVLQENGRLTIKELASRVSLSSTPVFERLRRLEAGGYIKKYVALLDAEKVNHGFAVYCNVKLAHINTETHQKPSMRSQKSLNVTTSVVTTTIY